MKIPSMPALPRRWLLSLALPLGLLMAGAALAQPEASLDQVYAAARAGHVDQALQMMQPVLRDHPRSAKAHYVEAELLARQGRLQAGRDELAAAERLSPGLPFAHADAVQGLRHALADTPSPLASVERPKSPLGGNWNMAAVLLGGALLVWLLVRLGWSRPVTAPAMPAASPGMAAPAWSSPGGFGMPTAQPMPAGGGLGQQLAGGLATGLAVGAGALAAEAIGHRLFSDGGARSAPTELTQTMPSTSSYDPAALNQDMGGQDFGIDDAASWDADAGTVSGDWDA